MATVRVTVQKVHQNIGDVYVGTIGARDLYDLAEADRIRLESLKVPKYAGFQRALVPDKVDAIRDYIRTPRSTFPGAIILSLDSAFIEDWDGAQNGTSVSTLNITRVQGAFKIIDGQHRVGALNACPEDFQVVVSIFIDLEVARCAEIFGKINSTQKAVNPSIAFQLFGYSEDRSPKRTAHDIAETLNTTEGSPFYKRLKMLGTKDAWSAGTLSQSTLCKELMTLYTKNPEQDENLILCQEKLDHYPGYPLRAWFMDGQDRKILETVWKFFFHVAATWPEQWSDPTGRSVLTKTTGYIALMRVLRHWLLSPRFEQIVQDRDVREAFAQIKESYTAGDRIFVRDNYPAGNQGVIKLRDALIHDLHLDGG